VPARRFVNDRMIKKTLLIVSALAAVLTAFAYVMYVQNRPPNVVRISSAEATNPTRPYVVKIHAQWCPVCMMTKGVWSQIESAYASRANLVVFDVTNQESTDASRSEARRLGLETVFDESGGWTGTILVLDGRTKDVVASIHGRRDFNEYRVAIDAALRRAAPK
jgi:thiol-disulfide isomerase/thioredoxin